MKDCEEVELTQEQKDEVGRKLMDHLCGESFDPNTIVTYKVKMNMHYFEEL